MGPPADAACLSSSLTVLPNHIVIQWIRRKGVQYAMTASGLVSRVTPVHTAVRNCTRDEGRALRGRQSGVDLKPPQAAVIKSHGGERCGKAEIRFRQARLREASASEPSMKCRKRIRRCQNRGLTLPPGSAWGNPEVCPPPVAGRRVPCVTSDGVVSAGIARVGFR